VIDRCAPERGIPGLFGEVADAIQLHLWREADDVGGTGAPQGGGKVAPDIRG
jgi:hypothetical protein